MNHARTTSTNRGFLRLIRATSLAILMALGLTGASARGGVDSDPDQQPATTGAITGRVIVVGELPPPSRPRINQAAVCGNLRPGDPIPDYRLTFDDETRALGDVVVFLVGDSIPESSGERGESSPETLVIEQTECRFEPRVVGVQIGQTVEFRQVDEVNHMLVFGGKTNPVQRVRHHVEEPPVTTTFDFAEVPVQLCSGFWWWMTGQIAVFDHPFFAVSDAEGEFRIENLPPGRYTVSVWHELETLASVRETVEVEVVLGRDSEVELEFQFVPNARGQFRRK